MVEEKIMKIAMRYLALMSYRERSMASYFSARPRAQLAQKSMDHPSFFSIFFRFASNRRSYWEIPYIHTFV